jgi:hypothetical protein
MIMVGGPFVILILDYQHIVARPIITRINGMQKLADNTAKQINGKSPPLTLVIP